MQPIRSAYCTLRHNGNSTHTHTHTFAKFINPHHINIQQCNFQHTMNSPNFAKPLHPIGMKMPNFKPLCLIILL